MEQLIVGLFLTLFAIEFVVEFGLNELNLCYVRTHWAERRSLIIPTKHEFRRLREIRSVHPRKGSFNVGKYTAVLVTLIVLLAVASVHDRSRKI
jgi:hypothetical protein